MSQGLMVLRSFHIPPEMDEALRTIAFEQRRTKAEVIRSFIEEGLRRSPLGNRILENLPDAAQFTKAEQKATKAALAQARRAMVPEGA